MTTSTPPDNTIQQLYPPSINGQTVDVEGAHIGVPLVAYDLVTDGEGAVVLVDPPLPGTMDPGDVMELWLEDELAALDSETIQNPDVRTTLRIPKGRLHPDKVNKLYYTVRRGSANLGTSTPPLEILYNRIRPGLKDRLTEPGGHSELKLLLPDVLKNGVGPDFVSAEVCVSYPYCRAYDVIALKCNGELLEPKPNVNPNPAPKPPAPGDDTPLTTCFTITRAYLDKAKRQDNKLHFSYTVTDQLGNGPDTDAPWSPVQSVDEDLDGKLLDKPILLEREEDYPGDDAKTIDLEKLAGGPLLLVVLTTDNRFVAGYDVIATYTATNTGQPTDVVVNVSGKVEADPFGVKKTCFLKVPNDKIFANSIVTVNYELRAANGDLIGKSLSAKAQVTGTAVPKLDPPSLVRPAVNPVDPELYPNGVTLRTEYLAAQENDQALLVLLNALPGTPTFNPVLFNKNKRANFTLGQASLIAHQGQNIRCRWDLIRAGAPTPSPTMRLQVSAATTTLNFENDPFTIAPAGRFTVSLGLAKNGVGVPDTSVELTLPTGFTFSDGIGGSRRFPTDSNGKLVLNNIKGSGIPGVHTLTAAHATQTVTAMVTVTAQDKVGTVQGIPYPYNITVSPDGTRAYVIATNHPASYGALSLFDTSTHEVLNTIALGYNLFNVVVSPDNARVYVTRGGVGSGTQDLVVLDSVSLEIIGTVPFSFFPSGVATSPDGSHAYVCGNAPFDGTSRNIRFGVVDTTLLAPSKVVNLQRLNTSDLAISPDGSRAYVSNANNDGTSGTSGSLLVVDTHSCETLHTIEVGSNPHGVVASPDGSRVYTARTDEPMLVVIDATNNAVIRHVPIGFGSWQLAITPDGKYLCTSEWAVASQNRVAIVDTATFSVRTFTSGRGAAGVTFSSDGTRIYVCNYSDHTVSVLNRN